MRALAEVLAGWGWTISGSDSGIRGHTAENLPQETTLVIYSDAIPHENPELCRATERGLPRLSYFQALGKITDGTLLAPLPQSPQLREGEAAAGPRTLSRITSTFSASQELGPPPTTLAIAGTHGKSTTTAIAAHILAEAGQNPTVFCGAAPLGKKSGGRAGKKNLFVVEACEYRKNFLHLRPTHAVLLGIEADHFDCFENLAAVESAFQEFVDLLPAEGFLLYQKDCSATQKVVQNLPCRKQSFGFSPHADWSAQNLRPEQGYYRFSIFRQEKFVLEVPLPIPGKYNILNALAAGALCWEIGCSAEQIEHGLATFPGLHRRFERLMGSVGSLSYVLDYAHHPTEVTAALQAAREVFPKRRIWCIFQPHQASRTARLLDELAISLQNADKVIVAEIFRAREDSPKLGEITAADLARRVAEMVKGRKNAAQVLPFYQTTDIMNTLATQLLDDDVIIVLGAGNIHSVLGLET